MTTEPTDVNRRESGKPAISVVLCTHNGMNRLSPSLSSLRYQSQEAPPHEVIVVDNASDDGTTEWLQTECARLGFRLVLEPVPGLSAARNRGVEAARSDWVYFIDDDAVAPSHWVAALWSASQTHTCDVIGGPVHPLWESWPPSWLGTQHWRSLSIVSWGPEVRYLEYPEILIGCNVGFRREALSRVGGFDPRLGRTGTSLIGGEERDIEHRIYESGGRILYVPEGYVFHAVPASRLTKTYLLGRRRGGHLTGAQLRKKRGVTLRLALPGTRSYIRTALRTLRMASSQILFEWQLITETRRVFRELKS